MCCGWSSTPPRSIFKTRSWISFDTGTAIIVAVECRRLPGIARGFSSKSKFRSFQCSSMGASGSGRNLGTGNSRPALTRAKLACRRRNSEALCQVISEYFGDPWSSQFLLKLNLELAAKEANNEPIPPPGLPASGPTPAEFVSEDWQQSKPERFLCMGSASRWLAGLGGSPNPSSHYFSRTGL